MNTDSEDRDAVGGNDPIDENAAFVSEEVSSDVDAVQPSTPGPSPSRLGWLIRSTPTLLVMIALGGLGYYGHTLGWVLPKFSELTGNSRTESVVWCDEHGVAEEECIACNADLLPKGELRGWCREHGIHECLLHHPELSQLREIPEVSPMEFERARQAIALRPRVKNDPACKMHLRRIQFPSIEAANKAGIDIGLVDRGHVTEAIPTTGEVVYDPTRVTRLSSRAPGSVWMVDKSVGDQVAKGDVLAIVDTADAGRTKAELMQAIARLKLHESTLRRLEGIDDVVAGKRILEAEAARAEAKADVQISVQALQNLGLPIALADTLQMDETDLANYLHSLGLPPAIVSELDPLRSTANLIPIVATRDGVIVERDVVTGEVVDTSQTLFTIADTSRMWLVLNVSLEEASLIELGQRVLFQPDGSQQGVTGTLTWISTDVDAESRTVEVRGELDNSNGRLRNETFGAGSIILREASDAILVSNDAVHWEGCCHVVFVRDKDWFDGQYKLFHTRSIRPGVVKDDMTEIIAGLLPGEVVVTKGSEVLRAELLKGNLGAG